MDIKVLLLVLLAAVLLGFFLMRRRNAGSVGRKAPGKSARPRQGRAAPRKPWRATTIVFSDKACAAVKAIGNHPFLDSEASTPLLPLPDCDAPRCDCRYAHRDDRRESEEDRRMPASLHSELYADTGRANRRQRRGRRKTDYLE